MDSNLTRYCIFENVLSDREIQTLMDFNSQHDRYVDDRIDVRSKSLIWDQDDFPQDIIERALDHVLPDCYSVEAVLFYTSKISFRLHADSGHCNNDTVYRNVLLPLEMQGPATTVLFDNHYTGPHARFARSDINPFRYNLPNRDGIFIWVDDIRTLLNQCQQTPDQVTEFIVNCQFIQTLENLVRIRQHADPRISDYTLISNYSPAKSIDPDLCQKYLNHMPPEDLAGLTVETVYQWQRGGALTFPRTQLHCAGSGHQHKVGVSIFTRQPS